MKDLKYFVYADRDGKVMWSPDSDDELFRYPRDIAPIANKFSAPPVQIKLDAGCAWEMTEKEPKKWFIVVTNSDGEEQDTASLKPRTLFEVDSTGITAQSDMYRGRECFESIPTVTTAS